MDRESLSLLGFPDLLTILEGFARSPLGKSEIAQLKPLSRLEEIETRLALLRECLHYREAQGPPPLDGIQDPGPILARLNVQGSVLEGRDFLTLLTLLKLGRLLKRTLGAAQRPRLTETLRRLPVPEDLIREIERTVDASGDVLESADPELARTRKQLRRCRAQIQQHLETYLHGPRLRFLIQDPYVTVRNGRYVIPVRFEHQREVEGVVHATSSSGATLFVEPFTAVTLNNRWLQHQDRERVIVHRLLQRLSDQVRHQESECRQVARKIAEVDALFAGAAFSERYRCVLPSLNGEGRLLIRRARHPLLLETLGEEQVVPVSVRLGEEATTLVVSGPNTGGKTLALKTVGLFSLMALAGLPVPAAEANLPLFRRVLADIGDHQSIAEHLSTFSAHVLRLKKIIEQVEPPSLILLDELGRGTDPVYGARLGIAVIDFFRGSGSMLVVTTHHQEIKTHAFSTEGIESASVKLDPITLVPTYELEFGLAGDSSGLDIAARLGLPKPLLDRARQLRDEKGERLDQYLRRLKEELGRLREREEELDRRAAQIEDRQRRLAVEFRHREQELQRAADKEIDRLASDFRKEIRGFLQSIKDQAEARRLRRESERRQTVLKEAYRRQVREHIRGQEEGAGGRWAAELVVGDWVAHPLFRQQGRVVECRGGRVVVEIEGRKITTWARKLKKSGAGKDSRRVPQDVILNVEEAGDRELNVVGLRVDEALRRADKFLDQAVLADFEKVRIVHGVGTGRLRSALSDFLSSHPHVDRHRPEGAVTVITLCR